MTFSRSVAVVGGCGHVGLPLGLAFADRGLSVALYDVDPRAVETVNGGRIPFAEPGAGEVLARVVGDRLVASCDPAVVSSAEHVVIVIGTPVDEHLNPDLAAVSELVSCLVPHLVDGQLLVLRSTVYPGTTMLVERILEQAGKAVQVSFCPERMAEGKAMVELVSLPQIVSGRSAEVLGRAERLFSTLAPRVVHLEPEEAELAKLFTNTWRYIKFATANQLFMIANDFGLDYERIRTAVTFEYPRAADVPSAGFAAGSCLLKDTMQLAAFNNNNFLLGQAAMMVNEGLPLYLVSKLETAFPLEKMTVGILGMSFKAESDDVRASLAYKLRRILRFKAGNVVCHDPYVTSDPELRSLEEVLDLADLLVVASPHQAYRDLETDVPIVDIWGYAGRPARL